jgi:hypothetical protein
MGSAGKCKVEGCDKNKVSGGMCWKHYHEKHGEPYKPKTHRTPFDSRQDKVDPADAEKPTPKLPAKKDPSIEKDWPDKAKDQLKAALPDLKPEKVIVDFTDYPELYQAIHKQAKESYRTIAGQMLYHIRVLIKIGEEAA